MVTYSGQKRSARPRMTQNQAAKVIQRAFRKKRPTIPLPLRGYVRTGGNYGRFGKDGELKYFDVQLTGLTNVSATATVSSSDVTGAMLVGLAQGTGESQRLGRQITVKSIQFSGTVTFNPGASANPITGLVKMYVVMDTQANGAYPTLGDIFNNNAYALMRPEMDNSQRFRILRKIEVRVDPQAGVSGAYSDAVRPFNFYKKCNIQVDYSSTTGAITEIRSNNIFLVYVANTSGVCDVSAFTRIRYKDS